MKSTLETAMTAGKNPQAKRRGRAWAELAVGARRLESLIPYARNARTHSDAQVMQVAASIREFGWTNPVLVDGKSGIIAGHARVLAAGILGMKEVPVIELAHLSDTQKRAYMLADNKLALNAGWDAEMLAVELEELQLEGVELEVIGFTESEYASAMREKERKQGLIDDDDVPELQEEVITQPGDLWMLGNHRLLCGDATKSEDVARLLNGAKPMLMVTDPPYGVEYDAAWRNKALKPSDRATGKVSNDDNTDWTEAWGLFPGEVAYVWHADRRASEVQGSLEAAAFEIRCQIIWAKNNIVVGRGDYHWQHEPCWYAVKKRGKGHWAGGRKQTTLWNIDKPMKSETGHSTQKPVECMRRPIENNSSPGQAVYDPFMGSGTTIIAAETTGRSCLGIEIAPEYCDIAIRRWQDFTGQRAQLANRGKDDLFPARIKPATKVAG